MTRILSLDDDPEIIGLYNLILEPKGYEHVCVCDSYEAWAMLCTEPFDLLTQDLLRPDIEGWAFYDLIRADESLCDLPVMIISAKSSDKDLALQYAKVDAFLSQPTGPRELLDAIQQVLERRGRLLPTESDKAHHWFSYRESVEAHIAALNDPDNHVRRAAINKLGFVWTANARQVLPQLIGALRDSDREVRVAAARALARCADAKSLDPSLTWRADDDDTMRQANASLVEILRDEHLIELLLQLLHDEDVTLRWVAALGLGRARSELAVEPLIAALRDEHRVVRAIAARALRQIKDERAVKVAVEAIINQLQEADPSLRQLAIGVLRQVQEPHVVDALVAALQDTDAEVAESAAYALGFIGDVRAVPHLERVAREDTRQGRFGRSVAEAARFAIERITTET
jgi:HEAT repeat protein/CheY-like chemotaxis protein